MRQGDVRLVGTSGRYPLERLNVPVTVTDAGGRAWHTHPPDFTDPVLFKLNGGLDEGRYVRFLSRGMYAVAVPKSWSADPATIVVEHGRVMGFDVEVYVCRVSSDTPLAFVRPDREKWTLSPRQPQFAPVGAGMDDFAEQGPLFGPDAPTIAGREGADWGAIRMIVIGSEGGRHGWRIGMKPNPSLRSQRLPDAFARRGSGWYFARLYDHEEELVESFDFRFVAGLRSVHCDGGAAWPGPKGHRPVCVTIASDHRLRVSASAPYGEEVLGSTPPQVKIRLPAQPGSDCTRWTLATQGGSPVALECRVSRVWWRLVRSDGGPQGWRDQPLQLRAEDMRATSEAKVEVRLCAGTLLRNGWPSRVHLRLGHGPDRTYPLCAGRPFEHASFPLRDLCDDDSFEPRPGGLDMVVSIEGVPGEARLAHVMLGFRCQECDWTDRDRDHMLIHLVSEHRRVLFETVRYEEIARLDSSFPNKVYVCSYCGYYAQPGLGSMTTDIAHHIEHDCKKAGPAPRSVAFRMATDADEVRRTVLPHLPWPFKCRCCGEMVRSPSEGEINSVLSAHIAAKHWSRFVRTI